MKKANVKVGTIYLVKVAGNLVPVRIDRHYDNGGCVWGSRKTGKEIRIKSHQRLRKSLDDAVPVVKKAKKATKNATATPERHTGKRSVTWTGVGGKPPSSMRSRSMAKPVCEGRVRQIRLG